MKKTADRDSGSTPEEAAEADQYVAAKMAEVGTAYFTEFAARFKREHARYRAKESAPPSPNP